MGWLLADSDSDHCSLHEADPCTALRIPFGDAKLGRDDNMNKRRHSRVLLVFLYLSHMRLALFFILSAVSALAQEPLRQRILAIAGEAHGKVSVACSLPGPGSALNCDLNPNAQPPMQSVFKLPLAVTVLHQIEQGTLSLDQPVRFLPQDRILPHVYSPLQNQYPDAGVDVPLRELLRLDVALSDNVAADILLRLVGGPKAVTASIAALGISGFHLQDSEAVLHHEVSAQYRNWFEPAGAVQLLRRISDNSPLTSEHTDLLLGWMTSDLRTKRLEGDLPAGTRVAHKSGTSDVGQWSGARDQRYWAHPATGRTANCDCCVRDRFDCRRGHTRAGDRSHRQSCL
jgi:beta-lactamase class A